MKKKSKQPEMPKERTKSKMVRSIFGKVKLAGLILTTINFSMTTSQLSAADDMLYKHINKKDLTKEEIEFLKQRIQDVRRAFRG